MKWSGSQILDIACKSSQVNSFHTINFTLNLTDPLSRAIFHEHLLGNVI
jgi:hypothetical protein